MPTFKPKSSKKIQVCAKSTTTLDSKHRSIVEEMTHEEEVVLPQLQSQKKKLKKVLKIEKNIEKVLDLEEQIAELTDKIKQIKLARKNYYLDNSKYVFEYYENKKHTATGMGKSKVLNSFFNIDVTDGLQPMIFIQHPNWRTSF